MVIRPKYGDVTDYLPMVKDWLSPPKVEIPQPLAISIPNVAKGIDPVFAAIVGLVALGGFGYVVLKVLK